MLNNKFDKLAAIFLVLAILIPTLRALAIDQAMPADHPTDAAGAHAPATPFPEMSPEQIGFMRAQDRSAFQQEIKLDEFRLLAIEHRDQVKILDSWARESLKAICNHETWNGEDPLYTALDMAFRPAVYYDQNIIFIQAVPIREALQHFTDPKDADRLLKEGLVSPQFLDRPEVAAALETIALDTRKLESVNKITFAEESFNELLIRFNIAPPAPAQRGKPWFHPFLLKINLMTATQRAANNNVSPIPGYSFAQASLLSNAYDNLRDGWQQGDAAKANEGISAFIGNLPNIDPGAYPSRVKRITELWYNRTFYGTVADVFLYFISMTLFLLVAVGNFPKLWRYGYGIFTLAVILHITSMGIRLWLAGRWPTQNEFESVLGAALFGCVIGWGLESWKKSGLFGMAFSFVGFLAMTACMAAPYVFGNDLGGSIGKTAGILQTYWLYIHVNIVIYSYALISATFVLGLIYLVLRQWFWVNPLEPGDSDTAAADITPGLPGVTLTSQENFPSTQLTVQRPALAANLKIESARAATLASLDQANMVILQMAFWFLGIGIICGAVWADHSWGRPWGWDPKETFALITWLVYLIIVHVRIVAPKIKADTTAWLSIFGFAIMMFNWIGVNFFLAGLHSYA